MNPIYYSASTIASGIDFIPLIEHLRAAHQLPSPAVERVLMQHTLESGTENGFLIWPAWQHGKNLGIKICTLFPENKGMPAVQALYVLFDGIDGSIQTLLDGTELTYWKTAADSALGADYLARKDAKSILMVGALIRGRWLQPGTHLDLIGGYTPEMREADDDAVKRSLIFVDSRRFTVEQVGDLTQPITNGTITSSDVLGDLFDLACGRCVGRQNATDITLFKSGGGAHLDLMTAQYIAKVLGAVGWV